MEIRFAAAADSSQLLKIYGQYIDTPITFEYVLPTEQEFTKRILDISQMYPYLVCLEGGEIIGYAYAHRQMQRAAYQWNAELSIYLDRCHTSRGIGKLLYCCLMDLLKLQGVKTVYGGVTLPNEKSERLHQALGFDSWAFTAIPVINAAPGTMWHGLKNKLRLWMRSRPPLFPLGVSRKVNWMLCFAYARRRGNKKLHLERGSLLWRKP